MANNNQELNEQQTAQSTAQQGASQQTGEPGEAVTVESLKAQLAEAQAEAQSYKDKYLREYADKENFRKSQERRMQDRVRREKRAVLEHLLEIVDNLDRSLAYQDTMDRNGLQQTLRMLQMQLNGLLSTEGLTPVPTVGEPFDPYVHEAIETVHSADHPEGVVAEEVRKGYKQGEDLLRPARVRVSAGRQGAETSA